MLAARKEGGPNSNFTPVNSDYKPDIQTKQKIVHSLSIPKLGLIARTKTSWLAHFKN